MDVGGEGHPGLERHQAGAGHQVLARQLQRHRKKQAAGIGTQGAFHFFGSEGVGANPRHPGRHPAVIVRRIGVQGDIGLLPRQHKANHLARHQNPGLEGVLGHHGHHCRTGCHHAGGIDPKIEDHPAGGGHQLAKLNLLLRLADLAIQVTDLAQVRLNPPPEVGFWTGLDLNRIGLELGQGTAFLQQPRQQLIGRIPRLQFLDGAHRPFTGQGLVAVGDVVGRAPRLLQSGEPLLALQNLLPGGLLATGEVGAVVLQFQALVTCEAARRPIAEGSGENLVFAQQATAHRLGNGQPAAGLAQVKTNQQLPLRDSFALPHKDLGDHPGHRGFYQLHLAAGLQLALHGHGLPEGGHQAPHQQQGRAAHKAPDDHRGSPQALAQQHGLVELPTVAGLGPWAASWSRFWTKALGFTTSDQVHRGLGWGLQRGRLGRLLGRRGSHVRDPAHVVGSGTGRSTNPCGPSTPGGFRPPSRPPGPSKRSCPPAEPWSAGG